MSDPSNENNTACPIGWLLLRDGHAVPLLGLEPDAVKRSCQHIILMPETELKHRRCLNAIVDTLGFAGDFGDYKHSGWPRFAEFLADHGCTVYRDLFADAAGSVFFGLPSLWGPNRRQLADRIQLGPKPSRVFLGAGIDWETWGVRADKTRKRPFMPWIDLKPVPSGNDEAIELLLQRRGEFDGEWGFLDDKLVATPMMPLVAKSYYDDAERMAELRDQVMQRMQTAVRVFRSVFDAQAEGWVDVLGFNDKLTVLRAHDGAWDVLWHDLREAPPPPERVATKSYVLHVTDRPEVLLDEQDLGRRLYFRREVWDEREAHLAEQHFYDRGGDRAQRRQTSDDEVRRLYLADTGAMPVTRRMWEGPPPAGFRVVQVGEVRRLVSDLVTVDEFRRMFAETGYLERRDEGNDDWERANVGAAASDPAGATWNDAQALCAWKERALSVGVRLLSKDEQRVLRPFFSQRYEQMAGGDFMWESFPPRPLKEQQTTSGVHRVDVPSAVAWSEPRFLPIEEDHPEFPADSGIATSSRKKWLTDFPPRAPWVPALPWAEHSGLRYIDAWDAYEWCQEWGWISGRFWEGVIGVGSWGAYKNVKVGVRLILDVDLP